MHAPHSPGVDTPTPADRKPWLTLADVADELGVSSRTVMRWVERGQLPAVVLPGGRKRVHRDTFDAWLAGLPAAASTRPRGRLDAGRMG
jgi:excisionase family DNA binding protein